MYCRCGQPIDIEYRWNGLAERVVFINPETREEIDHCPGCGESVTAWLELDGDALRLIDGALLDEPPIDAHICPICGGDEYACQCDEMSYT